MRKLAIITHHETLKIELRINSHFFELPLKSDCLG